MLRCGCWIRERLKQKINYGRRVSITVDTQTTPIHVHPAFNVLYRYNRLIFLIIYVFSFRNLRYTILTRGQMGHQYVRVVFAVDTWTRSNRRDRKYRQNGGEMIGRNSTDKESRRVKVEFKREINFRHQHFGVGLALRIGFVDSVFLDNSPTSPANEFRVNSEFRLKVAIVTFKPNGD